MGVRFLVSVDGTQPQCDYGNCRCRLKHCAAGHRHAKFGALAWTLKPLHPSPPSKKEAARYTTFAAGRKRCAAAQQKGGRSCTPCTQQRSLHGIQLHCPTTASSTEFCLLCCQPEPMPQFLTARMAQFTPWHPCRLLAWLGQSIHMHRRTCRAPMRFHAQAPLRATGVASQQPGSCATRACCMVQLWGWHGARALSMPV